MSSMVNVFGDSIASGPEGDLQVAKNVVTTVGRFEDYKDEIQQSYEHGFTPYRLHTNSDGKFVTPIRVYDGHIYVLDDVTMKVTTRQIATDTISSKLIYFVKGDDDGGMGFALHGDRGPSGAEGLKGDSGDRGPTGSRGPTGKRDDAGPEGPPEKIGKMGPVGARGGVGTRGERGDKGDTGGVGPRGPIGPQGSMGPRGSQGASGIFISIFHFNNAPFKLIPLYLHFASNHTLTFVDFRFRSTMASSGKYLFRTLSFTLRNIPSFIILFNCSSNNSLTSGFFPIGNKFGYLD